MRCAKYDGKYYDLCTHMYCIVAYDKAKGRYRFTWSNKQDRFVRVREAGKFLRCYFKEAV